MGNGQPKEGMFWIHESCFQELMDVHNKIESVEKYMKGELPKLTKKGNRLGYESVERFLIAMDDFNRRWNNSMKLIREIRNGGSLSTPEGEKDA